MENLTYYSIKSAGTSKLRTSLAHHFFFISTISAAFIAPRVLLGMQTHANRQAGQKSLFLNYLMAFGKVTGSLLFLLPLIA
jgi:hypothetical protein